MKRIRGGFTVVEMLIVIVVIGVLAAIVLTYVANNQGKAYYSRAVTEFTTFDNALKLYAAKYNDYPADVNRGLPAALNEFIAKQSQNSQWPTGPWPGSIYDYDRWEINDSGGTPVDTYQVSIRFCPAGGALSTCRFPKEPWAAGFQVNSSIYFCIKGLCRAHSNESATYPGYCVNCPNHRAIGT